jgi:tetratricopeptide (TPR) repeat protein/4-amino-4-deoxy-L-arabinose transferase-like glycosyltransferase
MLINKMKLFLAEQKFLVRLCHLLVPWLIVFLLVFPSIIARPSTQSIDEMLYMSYGVNIASGRGAVDAFGQLISGHPPMLPVILAFIFRLTSFSIENAMVVSKFFTWLNVLAIYYLGSKLMDRRLGFAAALIACSAIYTNTYATRILLDNLQSAFMLLSLVFLVQAFKTDKTYHFLVSGLVLGLGFLVKETSLLWLPLPLICAFLLKKGWQGIVGSIKFMIAFGLTIIPWWIYFYTQTGEIYLTHRPGRDFAFLIEPLGILLLFSLVVILVIPKLYRRYTGKEFNLELLARKVNSSPMGLVIGLLLLLSACVFLTIAIMSLGAPIRDLYDAINRFGLIWVYIQGQIVAQEPWQGYALWGWLLIIILAITRRNQSALILLLALALYFPFYYLASVPTNVQFGIRNFQTVLWLSYLALGFLIIWGIDQIDKLFVKWQHFDLKFRLSGPLAIIAFISLLGIRIDTGVEFLTRNYQSDYLSGTGQINYAVLDMSDWLNSNIPDDSRILSTRLFSFTIYLFTEDHIRLFQMPVNRIMDDYPRYASDLLFVNINNLYGGRSQFFSIFSTDDLLFTIKENSINYLIINTFREGGGLHLTSLPPYFIDHPGFELVYRNEWRLFDYYVFHVNHSLLDYYGKSYYPVSATWDVFEFWLEQLNQPNSSGKVFQLLEAINYRPIQILPEISTSGQIYKELAEKFSSVDINIAAFNYYKAMKFGEQNMDEYLDLSHEFIIEYPEATGPWALLGSTYHQLGMLELAKDAYEKAIDVPLKQPELLSVAYRGLGQLYYVEEDYQDAIMNFEKALDSSLFLGSDIKKEIIIATADELKDSGQVYQAYWIYNNVFMTDIWELNKVVNDEFFSQSIAYSFVENFDISTVTEIEISRREVYPTVFVIHNIPGVILFSHPPSEVTYQVEIPPSGKLHFAPTLAPAVWQPGKGDGVQFEIYLQTEDGITYHLYDEYIDPKNLPEHRQWLERQVNLSRWGGETVTISFVTGCGPNDDCRYDWAGWGEPRILQQVYYDFLGEFFEENLQTGEIDLARRDELTIAYETRPILFQHPTSQVVYNLALPQQPTLKFGLGMDPQVWGADKGDGVEYNVYVRQAQEPYRLVRVFNRYLDPKNNPADRRWFDERLDLSRFGGQQVDIIFEALPGPADDYAFDWGGWSMPVIIDDTLPGREVETGSIPLLFGISP